MADSDFVNVNEAVRLSGFSLTKFKSKKTRDLIESAGGSTEGTGTEWRVPVSIFPKLGTPRKRNSVRTADPKAVLENLSKQYEAAEAEVDQKKADLAEARKKATFIKGLVRKEIRRAKSEAKQTLNSIDEQKAAAEAQAKAADELEQQFKI